MYFEARMRAQCVRIYFSWNASSFFFSFPFGITRLMTLNECVRASARSVRIRRARREDGVTMHTINYISSILGRERARTSR